MQNSELCNDDDNNNIKATESRCQQLRQYAKTKSLRLKTHNKWMPGLSSREILKSFGGCDSTTTTEES